MAAEYSELEAHEPKASFGTPTLSTMVSEATQSRQDSVAIDDLPMIGGRYRLLTTIGSGGMSQVYLVLDTILNKQWAAKEIRHHADPVQNDLIVKSIVTEANLIKSFDHPAIPRIVDLVDESGTLYVIMDYIEGHTLSSVIETEGAQSESDVCDWALQLCDVLMYLHRREPSVVYRDMKPSNIMLKPNGLVELIDFGIACELSEDGIPQSAGEDADRLGTPGFAPPEQYEKSMKRLDARADVYALGATMFNLLTGKSPSEVSGKLPPLRQIVPSLSIGIERIVAKATQINPEDRYNDCAEFAYDLSHYQENDERARATLRKTWRTFVGLGVAAIIFCAIGFGGTIGRIVATDADFDHWMEIGQQSSNQAESTSAYVHAADIKPADTRPYLGLIKRYREDLYFDSSEEAQLRETLLSHIAELKNAPGYSDLAFRIGKLYWYSYGVDPEEAVDIERSQQLPGQSERIRAAAEWMHIAAADKSFDQHKLAQCYSDIADFNAQIVPLINEGDDSGLYKPYFDQLGKLVESLKGENNDVMKLQAANLVLDALSTYPRNFRADGITHYEMLELTHDAIDLASQATTTTAFLDSEKDRALNSESRVLNSIDDAFVDARTVDSGKAQS